MAIVTWIVLGVVAGLIASRILDRGGNGPLSYVLAGVVGAVGAGGVQDMFRVRGSFTFDVWSVLVPALGAVLVLATFHFVRGRPARDASWRSRR